jgi:hypothetical protein
MVRKIVVMLALCGFVCTLAACSNGPKKGEANMKTPENIPGKQADGTVKAEDSASATVE